MCSQIRFRFHDELCTIGKRLKSPQNLHQTLLSKVPFRPALKHFTLPLLPLSERRLLWAQDDNLEISSLILFLA